MTIIPDSIRTPRARRTGGAERVRLQEYAPHRLRYDFDESAGLFRHNIERDLNFFILWEKGRTAEERIAQLIRERFSLLYAAEIEWSEQHTARNFSRLYDRPDIEKAPKANTVGGGAFLAFVVCDENPRYVFDRSVSGNIEIVNANVAASKLEFRNMVGGRYLAHSSNNIREFFEQVVLLFGPKQLGKILERDAWDGQVHHLRQDLAGADGWADFAELFSVLNYSSDYLVLRNFESLPFRFFENGEKDIDILCDRLFRFTAAANAWKRGRPDKLSAYSTTVAGREIPLDVRYIGDGYYHERWQTAMLARKTLHEGLVYAPRTDDYFFSLLYHAKIQKREVNPQYLPRLEQLAHRIGMRWIDRDSILDDVKAAALLRGYMTAHRYEYVEPTDKGVVRNEAVLSHILKRSDKTSRAAEVVKEREPEKRAKPKRGLRASFRKLRRYLGRMTATLALR